ncbi:MAG: hypothetical protein IIB58_04610, partial [Planctomycetes bacterium]|nr:hypothetical protein [Planctomycetota bacterium]
MNYVRSSKKTNKKRLSSAKRKRKGMDPPRRSAKGRRDPDAETRPARDSQRPDRPDRALGAQRLSITRTPNPAKMTVRVGQICRQFGVNPNPEPIRIVEDLVLRLEPGTITLISGPSGSGKSAILQALEERCPRAHAVHRAALPVSKSIVDAVGSRRSLGETLQLLTACALGEPRLWLRQYDQLSEGEQFRARLAWCIDHHLHDGSSGLLLCDEFCAVLHRRAARSIAYNLRKLTTRLRLTLIVATCSPDVAADLQPDVILQL